MLLPREYLREVIEYISGEWQDAQLSKAMNGNVVPFPSKNAKERKPGIQSLQLDNLLP